MSARIRNPSPYTSTIGKPNAQILDIIFNSNTPVPLDELARVLGVKRPRNLKRNIALLEECGLIEEVDGGYVTPPDFEDRMERELEESGCNAAEELQRDKVAREQEAFRRATSEVRRSRVPREQEGSSTSATPGADITDDGAANVDTSEHPEFCPCLDCWVEVPSPPARRT